jgi:hypothetical protein
MKMADIQLKNAVKISKQGKLKHLIISTYHSLGYLGYPTFHSFELNFKYKINYYES